MERLAQSDGLIIQPEGLHFCNRTDLIISELSALHELFPALVGLGLEGAEDANDYRQLRYARSLASAPPGTGLLRIQMHIFKLKTGTNC